MKKVIQSKYKAIELTLDRFIEDFDNSGKEIKDARNTLKLFKLNDKTVNIKFFRVPNLINQIVYKYFRKSKAQRSFEYASKLLKLGIGTPQPIAFYEFANRLLFKRSFYVSEQLDYDLTYRELINDLDYPNHEQILREFTRFTFNLHEKGVRFLDHSPGNTLIINNGDCYSFYLVDLNRMKFEPMNFTTRIKNFSRLSKYKAMVEIMSDEYARCIGEDYNKVFNLMWEATNNFQKKHQRKQRLKKKLFFWQ